MSDARRVDALLVYPRIGRDDRPATAIATVTSGRRHVRLILALPPSATATPITKIAAWANSVNFWLPEARP